MPYFTVYAVKPKRLWKSPLIPEGYSLLVAASSATHAKLLFNTMATMRGVNVRRWRRTVTREARSW